MSTGFLSGLQNRMTNAGSGALGQFRNNRMVQGGSEFLNSNSLLSSDFNFPRPDFPLPTLK